MNDLEAALFGSIEIAQRTFGEISGDGCWLSHAPEHFIHGVAARCVHRSTGHGVFLEASPKKIQKHSEKSHRGPPAKDKSNRFDIVVWNKSTLSVRALVEIKHSWTNKAAQVVADGRKIRAYARQRHGHKPTGYLLVYREALSAKTCQKYAESINERLNGELLAFTERAPKDDDWRWSAFLIRL